MEAKRAPWGLIVVLSAVGLGVAGFLGLYVVRPQFILHNFGSFLKRHPVGSDVHAIAEDPFVDRATLVIFENEPRLSSQKATRAVLRDSFAANATGEVDIMWTHTPPFGRVSATFRYADGHILGVQTHDLD